MRQIPLQSSPDLPWDQVPNETIRLAKQAAAAYPSLRRIIGGQGEVREILFAPDTRTVHTPYPLPTTIVEQLKQAGFTTDNEEPAPSTPQVLIKRAFEPLDTIKVVADIQGYGRSPWGQINSWWGGSRPVSNILAGAALGAGLGYGGGTLAEALLPAGMVRKGRLRNTAALLSGGLMAVPGAWTAYDNWTQGKSPLESWDPGLPPPAGFTPKASSAEQLNRFLALMGPDDDLTKQAALFGGTDFAPIVPHDLLNRVPFIDPIYGTPIHYAGSSMLNAASASSGSPWVSAMDIARVAANAGGGWLAGLVAGKALGALAGLTPAAQAKLREVGTWSGIVSSAIPAALGMRF